MKEAKDIEKLPNASQPQIALEELKPRTGAALPSIASLISTLLCEPAEPAAVRLASSDSPVEDPI